MKKILLTISSFILASALAQGGLVVQPNGNQETDANGVTTLTDGGTVIDNVNGISIKASYIKVKEGAFLNANNATIVSNANKQSITASKIDWTFTNDRMVVSGLQNISSNEIKGLVTAFAIAYPKAGLLIAPSKISATNPLVQANSAVLDGKNREVFLNGNYVFQDKGKAKLTGSMLYIKFDDKGKAISTKTGSSIPEAVKTRFLGLLEKNR